jgi:hypothetical protein
MNKIFVVGIAVIMVVASMGLAYLLVGDSTGIEDDPFNGGDDIEEDITITVEDMGKGSDSFCIMPASNPSFAEMMILTFGGSIREAEFTAEVGNINPSAKYAVWATVAYEISGDSTLDYEIIESYAKFHGVPGGSLDGSRYYSLRTATGSSNSIATGVYDTPGSHLVIDQPDPFSKVYCSIPSIQGTFDLLGSHLDGLLITVGFRILYNLDGEQFDYYKTAQLRLVVTDTAQLVCEMVSISTDQVDFDSFPSSICPIYQISESVRW